MASAWTIILVVILSAVVLLGVLYLSTRLLASRKVEISNEIVDLVKKGENLKLVHEDCDKLFSYIYNLTDPKLAQQYKKMKKAKPQYETDNLCKTYAGAQSGRMRELTMARNPLPSVSATAPPTAPMPAYYYY